MLPPEGSAVCACVLAGIARREDALDRCPQTAATRDSSGRADPQPGLLGQHDIGHRARGDNDHSGRQPPPRRRTHHGHAALSFERLELVGGDQRDAVRGQQLREEASRKNP